MRTKVDVTQHFDVFGKRGRTCTPVEITFLPAMYKPARSPEHHWLHLTFRGFMRLRQVLAERGKDPAVFCSIGSSSGMDAIGAWEALPIRKIMMTDIIEDVLPAAAENVRRNCLYLKAENLWTRAGDLMGPLQASDELADVLYENLPVLPSRTSERRLLQQGHTAASFYSAARLSSDAPEYVRDNLLELHDAFLKGAASRLSKGGCVACAIGGRVPWLSIERMFHERGFRPEILSWTVKPQEQPNECLKEYARLEARSQRPPRFVFFPFSRVAERLRTVGRRPWTMSLPELLALINPLGLSANQAWEFYRQNHKRNKIAHLAYLVMGTPAFKEEA